MLPETKNFTELEVLFDETIAETMSRMKRYPQIVVYSNLLQQLNFMKSILLVEIRKPKFNEIESTSVGAIALKNFDDDQPYGDQLKRISYLFCEYKDILFLKEGLR